MSNWADRGLSLNFVFAVCVLVTWGLDTKGDKVPLAVLLKFGFCICGVANIMFYIWEFVLFFVSFHP